MSETPPSLFCLIAEGLVTKPTANALLQRLEPAPKVFPSFLDEETFATLTILLARMRPRVFRPTALEIALRIDERLASGKTDGWRYDALPPDGEATRMGLEAVEAEAVAGYGEGVTRLNGESIDALIRKLQRGETLTKWTMPPARFLEDLLTEVVGHAYAQPCAQTAIGYVGYADAKGWTRIGLNEREAWER